MSHLRLYGHVAALSLLECDDCLAMLISATGAQVSAEAINVWMNPYEAMRE